MRRARHWWLVPPSRRKCSRSTQTGPDRTSTVIQHSVDTEHQWFRPVPSCAHNSQLHQIHVPDSDLGDYPEDDRHYDGSGRVIDLDHLMIYGQEGSDQPYSVTYHGDGLPNEGIDPRQFPEWDCD